MEINLHPGGNVYSGLEMYIPGYNYFVGCKPIMLGGRPIVLRAILFLCGNMVKVKRILTALG